MPEMRPESTRRPDQSSPPRHREVPAPLPTRKGFWAPAALVYFVGSVAPKEGSRMAIAVQMDFPQGTLAQYDEVIQRMGFRSGGPGAPGGLFHWVAQTDDGIRVVDVWESRAQFDKFSTEQIQPITAQVGVAGPPKVQFFEVYSYLTKG